MNDYERIIASGDVTGIYESNYLKANAPNGSGAFWLKHNVLAPTESDALPSVAEFWCVLWRAEDQWRPRVWKQIVALSSVRLADDRVAIDGGGVSLEPDRAQGAIAEVSWDLAIRDELPPLRHLGAQWMYEKSFPRKKVVTGSPRAVFDGSFTLDGERIDVDGWVGHRNHNWGTEHAERYAYGGCNIWDDGAELTVEGFTVQVRLAGPVRSPWLTLVRGLDQGSPYGSGTVLGMLKSSGDVDWPTWTAWSGGRRERHRLEMELDPAHTAGLRYLHPDGELSYCYNAKDARVSFLHRGQLHTSAAGELEFLFPEPIEGIELHGHASIEELRDELG